MGVINNFIQIREMLKWRPIPEVNKISDTTANSVTLMMNVYGARATLERYTDGNWGAVGSAVTTATNNISVPLSGITTTSRCRIKVLFYGAGTEFYTNEFTVTRGAITQSMSAGKMDMKENLSETTDLKSEDIQRLVN